MGPREEFGPMEIKPGERGESGKPAITPAPSRAPTQVNHMTMNNNRNSKSNRAVNAENLSTGTKKHYPNGSTQLTVGNVLYTVDQIDAKLQEIVTLRAATTDAQTSAKARVAEERAQLPALIAFMLAYVAYVKAAFGNAPEVLADFGLVPKKARTPLTPEEKAAAKAKRKATREARGTVGPVKKLGIVGNVVGVTVTPVTAPAAPASPAAPAAPAASAAVASPSPQPPAATAPVTAAPAAGTGGASSGGTPAPHS